MFNYTQMQVAALNYSIQDLEDKNDKLSTRVASLEKRLLSAEQVIAFLSQQDNNDSGTGSGTATADVQKVLDYVKKHGIQVSSRWHIREEDDSGFLYLRDLKGTTDSNEARYRFRNGTMVNF